MSAMNVMASMSLVDMITGPLRKIKGQMEATGKAAKSLSNRALGLAKALAPVAIGAGVFLASLGACVSTAAGFEASMSKVGAVSRASAAEMAELTGAARKLGATTQWSAMEVAEGQKYLAMAGFSVQENIAGMPAILNMAAAGATNLGTAADIGSDILSAFGMEATEMGRVSDTLVATFTTSNTSLEMLGETMKYVAPVASKLGLSLEQTSAMAGLLGNVGIKSSQAGTAMRAMLNGLAAPSSEAAKAMEELKIKTTDAAGNLRDPIAILEDMAKATEGMGSAQKTAFTKTVFGTEAMSAALTLFDKAGSGGIAAYAEQLKSAGTAAEIAARQNDNLAGDMKGLGSAFESLKITIGNVFLPVMRAIAQGVTWVVRGFDAVAGHPLGKFLLWLAAIAGIVVIGITAVSAAIWAGTAAMGALNLALLACPITWVVIAIVALVAGMIALYKHCEPMRVFLNKVWEVLSIIGYAIKRELMVAWFSLKGALQEVGAAFGELWDAVAPLFSSLFGESDPLSDSAETWRTIGAVVGEIVGGSFRLLAAGVSMALSQLKMVITVISTMIDFFTGKISLHEAGKKLLSTFIEGIKSMAKKPYEVVKAMLGKVRKLLPFSDAKEGPLSSLTLSGASIMRTLGAGIQSAAPALASTASRALSGVALAAQIAIPNPGEANQGPASAPQNANPGGSVTIQNLHITLPDVKNADGFVAELKRLVEANDG